jgi:hypothetical protein
MPIWALLQSQANCAEFAQAAARATTAAGRGKDSGDPAAMLAARIARSLVEAGFSLHRCESYDPMNRLGGVCLLGGEARPGENPAGIVVACTTHSLLLLDDRRLATLPRRSMRRSTVSIGLRPRSSGAPRRASQS